MPRNSRGRPEKLGDHQLFSLRLPVDLHRSLRHYALDEGRSLNDVLVDVIGGWWDEQERTSRRRQGSDTRQPMRAAKSGVPRLKPT